MLKFSARSRWAIPAGSVVAVAVVGIAVAAIAGAQSAPRLPARSPAQLLALIEQHLTKSPGPLTATVQETSNLGLPAFPVPAASASPSLALPESPTLSLWYLNPQHFRVAVPVRAGETDLRLDGRTMWLWNSKTQTAVKLDLPSTKNPAGNGLPPGQSGMSAPGGPGAQIPDPASMARQVLAAVGPSTSVTVASSVYVAGRAAYQLSVQPRSSESLVGQILIAIDAQKYVPLRVQVFARGSSAPVYSIGFTSLTFGAPAASNFSFTPPAGAKVERQKIPGLGPAGLLGGLDASAFSAISSLPGGPPGAASPGSAGKVPPIPAKALRQMNASFARSLPASMPKAQRAAMIKAFDRQMEAAQSGNPGNGGGFVNPSPPAAGGRGPQDFGQDWLRVVASPTSPKEAAFVRALFSGKPLPAGSLPAGAASDLAALRVLARDATAVHGSWGSGWLLRTPLVSVLVESSGRVLFGAVEPAVLYSDAGA
ncbi:MAG TPA: hypothetical protein VK823_21065 [Streptosporangiaceae bacterium]|jgi:hypothetical protein|nr:hypothetical protein [Streptosporangiaceae bacterium]